MQSTEAIILRCVPYLETSHVITLFSREFGIISLLLRSSSKNKARSFSALLKVEVEVIVSEKELWKCRGIEILSSYPQLRANFERLKVTAKLLDHLAKVLPARTKVEDYYLLLDQHLHILPECKSPYAAAASFLVKYLAYEGSLNVQPFSQSEQIALKALLEASSTVLAELSCERTIFEKLLAFASL
jgi:DNA repair protein RecO